MEKRGKEIILLVLAIVLVAAAGATLFRRPAAPAKVEVKAKPRPKAKAAESARTALPTAQALLGASPGTSPNRNPFSAPAGAVAPVRMFPVPGRSVPAPARASTAAALPAVPPLPFGPSLASLPPFPLGGSPATPVAAPEPLRFIGAMRGERTLVLLRKGQVRYFVGLGDRVDEQYLLTSIGSDRVTLEGKQGKKIILHLGEGE